MSVSDPAGILHERAQQLARVPVAPRSGERIELLEFALDNERYAFRSSQVHDVQPLRELTPLPCTPASIRGLVNVHGRLVAVIDLKRFFGLPERGITDLHRVLLLRKGDVEIGLLSDTVEGVRAIDRDEIQPPLMTLEGIAAKYIVGVTPERLVVLDADAILDDPSLVVEAP
jgi:purine-binding chemotaxis protein CheW